MFNLSAKQSFWINSILFCVFLYMFTVALARVDMLGIILYAVFTYLPFISLQGLWRHGAYPFDRGLGRKVRIHAPKWMGGGAGRRW